MLYAAAYFTAVCLFVWLEMRTGIRRPALLVTLPLLVLDCAANCLVFQQSWRNTMSGELWHHKDHPVWGRLRLAVDRFFLWYRRQQDHCQRQALKEAAYGGFWPAYAADWRHA